MNKRESAVLTHTSRSDGSNKIVRAIKSAVVEIFARSRARARNSAPSSLPLSQGSLCELFLSVQGIACLKHESDIIAQRAILPP